MSPGPDLKLTTEEAIQIMRNAARPFWSVRQFADRADIEHPTARKRLRKGVEKGKIAELEVANASVYYLPGKTMQRIDESTDQFKADLREYWTDHFVGEWETPSIISTVHRTELTAGDRCKLQVRGRPGNWDIDSKAAIDESVMWLEPSPPDYTAIITGELYAKPTVPIEHMDYPDDYDFELNIGGEYLDNGNLVAAGVRNHLIKPCDNALFLQDVTVEKIKGEGPGMKNLQIGSPPEKNLSTKVLEYGKRQDRAEGQE